MKRKWIALLCVLMAMAMAFTFGGCKKQPAKVEKTEPAPRTQVDTRTEAYTAYTKDGVVIGTYKTIAQAINNAVATDSFGTDNSVVELGSYVEKDGVVIFQNRNGYAEASDDQFWFYTNGNQLAGYDCYDNTFYSEYFKNSNIITHEVVSRGSTAKQFHNGYGLYGPDGTMEMDKSAQMWELSTTMDAAALSFPARLKGVTGLDYELDMTNVQIKPNYEGTDDTYAFIGFYSWQDYYVIAHGIACDVKTGAWYPFEGSSRDDSFHDVTYKLGKAPLMVSTWNEEGGYWAPEYAKLTMSIRTNKYTDEVGDYYANKIDVGFYKADGTKDNSYEYLVDESVVQRYFSGATFGPENTFVFVTGLDVKTPVTENGVTPNTDYTNGAEFKNLKVVSATAHVPSAEEMPEDVYGYAINPDWIGQDFNILMASGDHEEGIFDYTILNTFACASYEKADGADMFSFSYAGSNVADTILGGRLAEYQAKIDELKAATAETVLDMAELIDEVAALYADGNQINSPIAQKYYLLLDFTPLATAQQLYIENAPLSEKGEEFAAKFNQLPSLATYAYVGYATDTEDAGYIMNDVAAFKALYDEYASQLTEDDKARWKNNVNISDYEAYVDLMTKVALYKESTATITSKVAGKATTMTTYSVEEAVAEIMFWTNKIAKPSVWEDAENDDPNANAKCTMMNSDNNWMPSYHVLFLKTRLAELGFELPVYAENVIKKGGIQSGFDTDFAYIDTILTLAKGIEDGTYLYVNEEFAAKANAVMVGKTGFTEGGLKWNFNNSGNADFTYREKSYKSYYGLDKSVDLGVYIAKVQAMLEKAGATADAIGITAAVEAQVITITDTAAPVVAKFNKADYHQADFEKYQEAAALYEALSEEDKLIVDVLSDYLEIKEMMETATTQLAAVALDGVANITVTKNIYYTNFDETVELTAKQALDQLNLLICKIGAGAKWVQGVESDGANTATVMNGDNTWFQSVRVVVLMKYFAENNVELPEYFAPILEAIGYNNFLEAFDSIYQTINLAETYAKAGKTVADMTAEDKAAFEKYWAPGYTLSSILNWNWNSGQKFETYFSARVRAIALLYAFENSYAFDADVMDAETTMWIYGDCKQFYTYKGESYWAFVYEDEAGGKDLTHLFKNDSWNAEQIFINANGDVCAADAEGATPLTITTEGVVIGELGSTDNAGDKTNVYVTADGQKVYKPRVWRPEGAYIDYEAEGFVDAYNRPVELTAEQLAQVKLVGVVKVYKFYDKLGAWLVEQGYTLNANGWGYSSAPEVE